jgi:hypothetical protein
MKGGIQSCHNLTFFLRKVLLKGQTMATLKVDGKEREEIELEKLLRDCAKTFRRKKEERRREDKASSFWLTFASLAREATVGVIIFICRSPILRDFLCEKGASLQQQHVTAFREKEPREILKEEKSAQSRDR